MFRKPTEESLIKDIEKILSKNPQNYAQGEGECENFTKKAIEKLKNNQKQDFVLIIAELKFNWMTGPSLDFAKMMGLSNNPDVKWRSKVLPKIVKKLENLAEMKGWELMGKMEYLETSTDS
ncbi:MAG: hypothetical protein ACXAB2_09520 [Candidatus Hodarchaeales archaeon]